MSTRGVGPRLALATLVVVSIATACSSEGNPDGAPITRPSSTLLGPTSSEVPGSDIPTSAVDPSTSDAPPDSEAATTVDPTTTPPSESTTPESTPPESTALPVVSAPVTTVAPEQQVWPVPDWQTQDSAAAGLDPAKLALMADRAERAESDCLVVTHDGSIVGEWYWNEATPLSQREAFSVTKSIASTLVGIAIDQGFLTLDQKASDYITEWVGTPSEDVTVRNLVSNDSGRFQTNESDYITMPRQDDMTAYAIGLEQEHDIGEVWVYNNAAIQTLEAVLERSTGMDVGEFAIEYLIEPLGMQMTINKDKAGNTLMFFGAQASCRDLARFGLLFLRGGEWDGQQIVSKEWVEEATSPSTELNSAYGFLWWLTPSTSRGGGPISRGAPEDMFAAHGLFDQLIGVLPSDELVVTRMGEPQGIDGTTFGHDDIARLVSAT